MSYNYQGGPSPYGGPPGVGGRPGQPTPTLGMDAAPGMGPPPGSQPQNPGAFPSNFQTPANMPNFNFTASVIRMGMSTPGKPETPSTPNVPRERDGGGHSGRGGPRGAGLGFDGRDQQRHGMRDQPVSIAPPTREEIARTIFVGNITSAFGSDEALQRILGCVGGLRRWTRATDGDGKPCSFGFAEYEDADSLAAASEVLQDVRLPSKEGLTNGVANGVKHDEKEAADAETEDGDKKESDEPKEDQLLVVIDDASRKYIEDWRGKGSLKDPAEAQFRIDQAKDELAGILVGLTRPPQGEPAASEALADGQHDADGDVTMQNSTTTTTDAVTGEVVTIPISVEDELSDIPAEMRETVTKEIAAFRDRSNRKDLERLKKEEEMEQAEKQRNTSRANRLATPPLNTPTGPRDRGIEGAPIGPKGFQGAQIPRDYQKGVSFVNGMGSNGFTQEEQDSDASDEELKQRRKNKTHAEQEKIYLDQERRWLNRERNRTNALERQRNQEKEQDAKANKERELMAARLREYNDDEEAIRRTDPYFSDNSMWQRQRDKFLAREMENDELDRAEEEREKQLEQARQSHGAEAARRAEELESQAPTAREPQRFKLSLGAAAQRAQVGKRRTAVDVELLLEDEEENETAERRKRTLVPLQIDTSEQAAALSPEERQQAARQLASEIPAEKEGLWNWPVKWDYVDEAVINEQLRPFMERKIMEYLGVQEQMLVDVVAQGVKDRAQPQELVAELQGALDEEAEPLVKKLWRMLIFFSETEKRGLNN